ncbi:MAG: D-glycerate dehydrogenase [Geminicoccaceae bacterium]|nr:D-glycerate dehydrogenase [Geminicoccaceae bacterium]
MTKPRVLVTRRWPEAVEAALKERYDLVLNEDDRPMDEDGLRAALRDMDAVLPTVSDRLDAAVFEVENPKARFLGNYGVGYSHIDTEAAKRHGIVVTNTPDVLSDCTADLAMALLLASARRIGEGERQVRGKAWSGWHPMHMQGGKVAGKTLGIIGFGRIGREVAKRAHHGFDMKVVYFDKYPAKPEVERDLGAERRDTVDDVLAEADFVSLHCPGGQENYHLIDAERLKRMKPTAYLVNTARGEVVDGAALAEALNAGTIAGAGLDVYEGEPKVNEALLACENAVLLPHLGSATKDTRIAMGMRVLQNLDAFFAGKEPPDRVA